MSNMVTGTGYCAETNTYTTTSSGSEFGYTYYPDPDDEDYLSNIKWGSGSVSINFDFPTKEENKMKYNIYDYVIIDRKEKVIVSEGRLIVPDNSAIQVETLCLVDAGLADSLDQIENLEVMYDCKYEFNAIEEED